MLTGDFMGAGVTQAMDEMSKQAWLQVHAAMNGVMAAVEEWLGATIASLGKTINDIDMFLLETHDMLTEVGCWSKLYKLRYYADRVRSPDGVIVGEFPVKIRFVVDGP